MRICLKFRLLVMLLTALFFCVFFSINSSAEEVQIPAEYHAELDLPETVEEHFNQAGITADDPESIQNISPAHALELLLNTLREEAAAPVVLLSALLTLTLLSGLFGGVRDAVSAEGTNRLLGALFTLVCAGAAAKPLCSCLERTAGALEEGQAFMLSYIPVFTAFLAAGGSPASGAAYQVFMLFLCEAIVQLTHGLLFPLLQMSAALGIVDAVNPQLRLGGIVSGFKTAVSRLLGAAMTLFTALLSVRGIVASSADQLTAKTVKLLSADLIPIIGSAVSDAFGTVQGSMVLLRNSTGAVGILAILLLTLPPLISLLLYRAVFAAARIFAETAGAESAAALFRNMQAVLAAAFAMLVCYAVMLIISTAIMMMILK